MYKRSYINEDPYVNIFDHSGEVMYAENSYPHHNQLVRTHGGMDVFIKTSSNGKCQYQYIPFIFTFQCPVPLAGLVRYKTLCLVLIKDQKFSLVCH